MVEWLVLLDGRMIYLPKASEGLWSLGLVKEPLDSTRNGDFIDQLSNCHLSTTDSAPCEL